MFGHLSAVFGSDGSNVFYTPTAYDYKLSDSDWSYVEKDLINQDLKLYEKATRRFNKKIESYGSARIINEIKKYKNDQIISIMPKPNHFREGRFPIIGKVNEIRGYYDGGPAWCPSYKTVTSQGRENFEILELFRPNWLNFISTICMYVSKLHMMLVF